MVRRVSLLLLIGLGIIFVRSDALAAAAAQVPARSAAGAQIDIPINTWIAKPLPPAGQGPCPGGACKHERLALNPVNGRIYFCGGDYDDGSGAGSGRNDIWSYSIANDDWIHEYPGCAPPGEIQAGGPDEVGWCYDTRRNLFWMVPGYMWGTTCPGSATVTHRIMTFDPVTRKWADPNAAQVPSYSNLQFAQYDPLTDTIIQFGGGGWVGIYNIQTNTWTSYSSPEIGNMYFDKEYSAIDLAHRRIFLIEPASAKIFRYDMDSHRITELGAAPTGSGSDLAMPLWDSANQVVLWPLVSATNPAAPIRFYVYHPDTNAWEYLPNYQPEAIPVKGRNAVYDPYQNCLWIAGINDGSAVPYFFLYRYGNGSGAPIDTSAPGVIGDLRPR